MEWVSGGEPTQNAHECYASRREAMYPSRVMFRTGGETKHQEAFQSSLRTLLSDGCMHRPKSAEHAVAWFVSDPSVNLGTTHLFDGVIGGVLARFAAFVSFGGRLWRLADYL